MHYMPQTETPDPAVSSSHRILKSRHSKFIASYQLTGNATESAINAGYSAKNARIEGYRLLKNPRIVAELEQWRANKEKQSLSKESFIDKAMERFERLDDTEPNSPRFLDIAGKALGYIGSTGTNTVTNNTQVNITTNELSIMPNADKWTALRGMLET